MLNSFFLAQWFNPFAWLIKDAIKNNLEYKTDHIIAQNNNPQEYQLAMVGLADKEGVAPFLTALNGSQLKNRIIMMKKKTENKYSIVKQLVVLPLLAILVMGLSNREIRTEIVQPEIQTEISRSEKTIKGKVTGENGEPLEGVSVVIKNRPFGTITDQNGNYIIEVKREDKTLIFGFLDIDKKEISIDSKNEINVQLNTNKKSKEGEPHYRTGNLYDGTLRIRNSEDEMAKPLFIVDGVEKEGLEDLSPGDMLSMSVLKDEIAEEFYGTKGKNGVVQIGTKDWKFPSGSNPLIIVDEKEYDGSIEDIPKDKIFHVRELHYPNFTAKYGEKGKDGVIEIETTKMRKVPALINNNNKKPKDLIWASFGTQTDLSSLENVNPQKNSTETKTIKGKVTDQKGDPISGASILIKGKPIGTITDPSGNYEIGLDNEDETLIFAITGFEKQEIKVDGKTEINLKLKAEENPKNDEIKVTGYGTQIRPTTVDSLVNAPNTVFLKNISGENEPLYILDGIEIDNLEDVSPSDIESISVLKDTAAVNLYGEKGKNGVILVTTKEAAEKKLAKALVIVDGKVYYGDVSDVSPEDIESVEVLKNESATKLYGEKAKDGAIIITTKNQLNFGDNAPLIYIDGIKSNNDINDLNPDKIKSISVLKDKSATEVYGEKGKNGIILIKLKSSEELSEGELPIVLNGRLTQLTLNEVDRDLIQNINRLEPKQAVKKYGEKGKKGVFEISSRKLYTDKVEVKSRDNITTQLELRKFIAWEIKYPVLAQEANREKVVKLSVHIDKNGNITSINETDGYIKIRVDEVVVMGNKSKDNIVPGYGSEKEVEDARKLEERLMVDETKRVINKIPEIDIPEFKGKTVGITVKFILQ